MRSRGEGRGRIFRRAPKKSGDWKSGGSRFWWIAYTGPKRKHDGSFVWGEIRESTATEDEKKAQAFLRKRLREVGNHRAGVRRFRGPSAERITLEELLRGLEQDYEIRGRTSRKQLRSYLKHVRGFFKGVEALAVTSDRIRDYIAARQRQGAAASTINHETKAIGRAFALAADKIAFAPNIITLREDNIRQVYFTNEQADATLDEIRKLDSDAHDFYAWLNLTAMRPKAIAALQWGSLDREKDEWTIDLSAKDDKSRYGRPLPVDGLLKEIIERRLKARSFGCPWIFSYHGNPANPGWLQKHVFNAALKALKLPSGRKEGYTPYDLKRTALRTIRRSGTPEERAMRISGHLTSSTFRRYNLTDVEDLRQDLARRDEYLRKQRRES
jgi:hypothetical protein